MNRATETPPAAPASKGYNPTEIESEVAAAWDAARSFHAEPSDPGKPYAIVIPPPNVTAALHLGHALNNTLQDILIRQHRMMGDNTVWLPGTDHAGIATQTVVEKRVLKEEGKKRTEFEREVFVAKIQAWKDEYEQTITGQLKAMGCSCDWERQAFTMDEARAKAVREAFFRLFKDGLIYRGKRLVNWDPLTLTALADDEVENEEVDGFFYYLRYPLTDGSGHVTVATTRPETMLGDTAVAINPKDPRAAALKGKLIRLPIVGREIRIVEDDYVVMADPNGDDPKAKFATGFLKVTPAHDPNDYEIGKRHGLAVINVMAPDASISDKHGWTDGIGDAGFLLGMSREAAREAIVEWFRRHDLLVDVKPYRHSVGHSYRSHVPIEPYLSDQWYCKVTDPRLAGAALAAMSSDQRSTGVPPVSSGDETETHGRDAGATTSGRGGPPLSSASKEEYQGRAAPATADGGKSLTFFPARYARTFQSWHENIRDWCISRQLWWGHRIPVWTLGGAMKKHPPDFAANINRWNAEGRVQPKLFPPQLADDGLRAADHIPFYCVKSIDDVEVISFLESLGYRQDPDVLDTWFSSGLWPLSTLGWPNETADLAKWNPTNVLCTAREIITLWVSRMVMFNLYLHDRLPFTDVFIHAMIQDGEGRKMSKSLGNGVDPLDIIASHGTDAMRFTLTTMATNTQDVRMPVERDVASGRNTSPKFDLGRNFCNKLWNAGRFVVSNLEKTPSALADPQQWSVIDRWILSRLAAAMREANAALSEYRFDQYAKVCYDFFWRDFCDWYVEAVKPAMRDPARAPQTANVLAACLSASLRLMHPMIPFITEKLFWRLNEVRSECSVPGLPLPQAKQLIRAAWPTLEDRVIDPAVERQVERLQGIIAAIRNVRNLHKIDPRKPVTVFIKTAEPLASIEAVELLATCRIASIGAAVTPASNATAIAAGDCEIFIEGLVDETADAERNAKRKEDLLRQKAAMEGRLNNAGYIAKAPLRLVEETRQQLATVIAELEKI